MEIWEGRIINNLYYRKNMVYPIIFFFNSLNWQIFYCIPFKLKSLIAALHASHQANGHQRKEFDLYEVKFGWQALKDLWRREMARAKAGTMRRVPQLCYRHVYRDCWTRLNVKPAKIMQVGVTTWNIILCYKKFAFPEDSLPWLSLSQFPWVFEILTPECSSGQTDFGIKESTHTDNYCFTLFFVFWSKMQLLLSYQSTLTTIQQMLKMLKRQLST